MRDKAYAHGPSHQPLLKETIGQNLRNTVTRFPGNTALVCLHQNYRATYAEFWQQVEEVAKGFLALDVKKGDRVAMWSPNRFEWVLVQYATARIGAILVNINPAYKMSELEYVLSQSGASVLVSAQSFQGNNYKEMIWEAHSSCKNLKEIIFLDESWEEFVAGGKTISNEVLLEIENTLHCTDAINIQYTSGTTGFPKGVTLSHYNILNNGYFVGRRLNYSADDKYVFPFLFIIALVWSLAIWDAQRMEPAW
jgi:fatty-acyl-CoA synthase